MKIQTKSTPSRHAWRAFGAAALFTAAAFSQAQAVTYGVYITGPQSWRTSATNAIANILTNPVAAYTGGATLSSALQITFQGTIGSDSYIVYVSYIGSEQALKTVSQSTTPLPTLPFIPTSYPEGAVTKATAPAVVTGGTLVSAPTFFNNVANASFADQWQASSQFKGTYKGVTYAALTPASVSGFPTGIIGVQPYKVIASARDSAGNSYTPTSTEANLTTTAGSKTATLDQVTASLKVGDVITGNANLPADTTISAISGTTLTLSSAATVTATSADTFFDYAGLGNITDQLAKKAFTSAGGSVAKLSQFSGSDADSSILVYAVGRSHDAGQRAGFVLETGIDKPGTGVTAIQQYFPLDADGNIIGVAAIAPTGTPIASLELAPAESVNGIQYLLGQSGYKSGSTVAQLFAASPLQVPNTLLITYLGVSDAKTALTGNAQELAFNGVSYSTAAVQQGLYSLWGFEHLYYNKHNVSKGVLAFINLLASQTATSDASVAGIKIDANFKATRTPVTVDGIGSVVTQ